MKIALDYDGTYAEDPELWDLFIEQADERGHEVTIVTMRDGLVRPIEHEVRCDVIYTNLNGKLDYCEALGIDFDIWIDDHPEWVLNDWEDRWS